MFEVLWFILKCVVDFLKMLFSIDVGITNLGVMMCICFIFLPMVLSIVNFLKSTVIDEFDDKHDFGNLLYGRRGNSFSYQPKHTYKPKHSKKY